MQGIPHFSFLIFSFETDELTTSSEWCGELIENSDNRLDPLEEPLIECGQLIKQRRGSRSELNRLRGRIEYLGRTVNNTTIGTIDFRGNGWRNYTKAWL